MNQLQQFIQSKPCGFLRSNDIADLIRLDRLCPVLARFQSCRLTCAAQDVAHIIDALESAGDRVRDVSFPVGSMERAENWQPDCVTTPCAMLPASFINKPKGEIARNYQPFNEADCGGAFDGNQVISDADPGL